MSLVGFIWVAGAFLLALAVLITVHELGHYWAARLCNVKILRFSIGFGRPLWTRKYGRDATEWALAAFPLGGYVKMLDEREEPVAAHERVRAFNRQSVGRRAFIVVAGPLANLLLAILLYWGLFMHGIEEPRAILAAPSSGTLAAEVRIGAGEVVRTVAGKPVASWSELRWEMLRHLLERDSVVLETEDARGQIATYRLDLARLGADALEGDPLQALGLRLFRPDLPPVIGSVAPGSPADIAGLHTDDRIVAIDGQTVGAWHDLAQVIRASEGRMLMLTVERDMRHFDLSVTPQVAMERGKAVSRIGIGVRDDPQVRQRAFVLVRHGPVAALGRALDQTWETSVLSLRVIGRILTGDMSVKNISGPVTIADYAGQSARLGIDHYLRFLALISISLGVLNLLPVPVLDGGHLMYYLAEVVKGGPLSERVTEIGQQVGLALLALLMILALYNDIHRLISG